MANWGTITGYPVASVNGLFGASIDWTITDQSLENNTTTISWMVQVYTYTSQSAFVGFVNVNVDGKAHGKVTNVTIPGNSSQIVHSGTSTITHGTDGTKTFRLEFNTKAVKSSSEGSGATITGWQNFDLDPIKKATISSVTAEFTDDENPTITYSNPLGEYVDYIEACISFTGANDDIPYREIPRTGTSYTFPLTDDERDTLRSLLYDGTIGTVRFYIRTTDGTFRDWDYKTANVKFVNYTPTLSPTVSDANDVTYNLTGDRSILIKYFSKAAYKINGQGRKGAYIVTQFARNGEYTTSDNFDEGVIEGVTSNTFYFSVTDNKGYTTNSFVVFNNGKFIDYIKPSCHITVTTPEAGKSTITITGMAFKGSFGAKTNALTFKYTISENGGGITENTISGTPTYDGNNFTLTHEITGLNQSSKYTVGAIVSDLLTSSKSETRTVGAISVFDWSKDDFQHNTDVVIANDKAINGVRPDGTWVKALEPCNVDGDTTIGKTAYEMNEGTTKIYGNSVEVIANNPLKINGRELGCNKVLWSGAWYMNGSQMATLSEAISAQPNGIVLVFSLYRDGAAADVSINTFFVSKKEVELLPGAPHTFFMAINNNLSVVGCKYLRISDTSIDGDDSNTSSGTASGSGITFNNSNFVLRYVIGV